MRTQKIFDVDGQDLYKVSVQSGTIEVDVTPDAVITVTLPLDHDFAVGDIVQFINSGDDDLDAIADFEVDTVVNGVVTFVAYDDATIEALAGFEFADNCELRKNADASGNFHSRFIDAETVAYIQVLFGSATNVNIYGRVHREAPWVELTAGDEAADFIMFLDEAVNYVKIQTDAAGTDVMAWTQDREKLLI